jgi:hypothetical protein
MPRLAAPGWLNQLKRKRKSPLKAGWWMGGVGSVQRVFQRLGWQKFRRALGRNIDGLASAWVAACACWALFRAECSEARNLHGVAFLQGVRYGFSDGFQGAACFSLGNVCIACDALDQFGSVHGFPFGGSEDGKAVFAHDARACNGLACLDGGLDF